MALTLFKWVLAMTPIVAFIVLIWCMCKAASDADDMEEELLRKEGLPDGKNRSNDAGAE